jgi:TonB-dependent receptor
MHTTLPLRRLCAALLALAALLPALRAADATGSIAGQVANATTRNLLAGARIEVPALGLSALSDDTGRYELAGIPAGAHELTATYLGLDVQRVSLVVAAGQRAVRNFDLTSAIYQLDTFKVTGEREGNAVAITAQRNAPNVMNVVAIDAYGNLPNMNASELAILLPGVAGNVNDEGNINAMTIRGMGPGLNTITIDGAMMGSQGGSTRQTRIHTITGSMFDQLELVKGHRPDRGMDSLGGTINLKSRSPLALREKRRTTYNFSARTAPPGTQQIPMREAHRTHPLLNVAHQEVFDFLGGDRNLGIAANLFYSEQAVGVFSTTRDFQSNNAPGTPAYLWDYNTQDNYNNRKQGSVNLKADWRLAPHTKLSVNTIYNDAMERFRLRYNLRMFVGNATTAPSATSGIVPGFTNRITEVRATAGSTIDITSQMSQFYHRQRHISAELEHRIGALELDAFWALSVDRINGGGGDGGVLVNRLTNVGWRIDRTASDLYPRIVQTAGPSWSNPANYRPNAYNFADTQSFHEPREWRANARYKLPLPFPFALKTGFRLREESVGDESKSRVYTFTTNPAFNSASLPTDPTLQTFGDRKTGLVIPGWNANAIARGRTPLDASLWTENLVTRETNRYTGARGTTETVTAGYGMFDGRIGRVGFLGGVRTEKTETESWGYVRNRTPIDAALRASNLPLAISREYTLRELRGEYTKSFPSLHVTYDFTPNFKTRASWSTSFGRPPLNNLQPAETYNATADTLTINNPSLRPQTAKNVDLALDYYFEPVGNLSVGWFRKDIEDYFVNNIEMGRVGSGIDNGYNGDYAGAAILTRANLGNARVEGWEFNYQQQFTFLPGALKGLGASLNYTLLRTRGNFGGAGIRATGQVAGFIPRAGNASLTWRYRKFGTRLVMNRTGEYIRNYTAAGSGANQFTRERTIVNAGLAYQWRPTLGFSLDVQNVFNEPQVWYRGIADNVSQVFIPGPTVTLGVSGRF